MMPLTLREQRVLTEGLRTLKRRATIRIESEQACLRLIDDLLTFINPPVNRATVGSKSWKVGQLLLRPQGCTASEAMRVLGWPSISMVQQARICGLQLVRERRGRGVRYYARVSNQTTSSTAMVA